MPQPPRDAPVLRRPAGRWALWCAAALLWLLPAVAMQFTDEVAWTARDFVVFGALLAAAVAAYQWAARVARSHSYRAAAGVAVAGAFLLLWANGAVGLVGSEGHPANALLVLVLALGVAGALVTRGRPQGLAHTLVLVAAAQALVTLLALAFTAPAGWLPSLLGTAFFVMLWLVSAALFRRAARQQALTAAA